MTYIRKSLVISIAVACIAGCSSRNISHEKRFSNVIGKDVRTKKLLGICKIDPERFGNSDHYDLMVLEPGAPFDWKTTLPLGTTVRFIKATSRREGMDWFDQLEGSVYFRRKTYPVAYSLGPVGYGDAVWGRMYESFEIAKTP